MASIKVNDIIPEGTFKYVPYTPDLEDGVSGQVIGDSKGLPADHKYSYNSLLAESVRAFEHDAS